MATPLYRRELYRDHGATSRVVDVAIDEQGRLIMSAQDVGEAPREIWGDEDYEFWVTVPAEQKAQLRAALLRAREDADAALPGLPPAGLSTDEKLLTLLEQRYRGNPQAVDDFREFLTAQGVAFRFENWV